MIRRWQLQVFMWQGNNNTKNSHEQVTGWGLQTKAGRRCGGLACWKGLGKGEQDWEERMRKALPRPTKMTSLAPIYWLKIVNIIQFYPSYLPSGTHSIYQLLPLHWRSRSWNALFLPTKCCHIIQNSITKHKSAKISPYKGLLRLAHCCPWKAAAGWRALEISCMWERTF